MTKFKVDLSEAGDDRKLGELILYISEKSGGDDRFGATKLNKLLFFADFSAYWQLGRPITNQAYFRLSEGPAPRRLLPVRKDLEDAGDLVVSDRTYHGRSQKRTVPLRSADLSMFRADEIAIVDQLIEDFWGLNAREISDLSHRFAGWKLAADQENIPYQAAFISSRPLTDAEKRYALELVG